MRNATLVLQRLFHPVDIASLVVFRIVFGAIMLWEVYRFFSKGWIERYYITPDFHFTYLGFGWISPWEGDGMYIHFVVLGVLAIGIMLGLAYRLCAILFFFSFTYVFLLDQARYLNHFYLVILLSLLLALIPAHRAFSVDAYFFKSIRSQTVPAWTLWVLRFQLAVVYIYAAIAKMNIDWLHGEPMRDWLSSRTDLALIGPYFTEEWMVYGFSYGGLLLDLFVVPFLLWQPTRWLAFGMALLFHLLNYQLFHIGIFPFMMVGATTLFLSPSYPRKLIRLLRPKTLPSAPVTTTLTNESRRAPLQGSQRVLVVFLVVYVMFQLLFPLRHWIYPGDVNWNEEGHRFSWRMKLRDKDGAANFIVHDQTTDTRWTLSAADYLLPHQWDEMSTRPDMILQFVHYLHDRLQEPESGELAIHVETEISLNSRPFQPMIDPTVDLASQPYDWRPRSWITELN